MKKALAMLLTLAMALSMLPMAFADVAEAPLQEAVLSDEVPEEELSAVIAPDTVPTEEALLMAKDNEAKIDTQEYATLQEAADKAQEGDTITLLKSIEPETRVRFSQDITLTLDLDGHTFSSMDAGSFNAVLAAGSLTVQNGTMTTGNAEGPFGVMAVATGAKALIMKDVTLYNYKSYGQCVDIRENIKAEFNNVRIVSNMGGGVTVGGGTADFYNCTFEQSGYYDHCSCNISASNGGVATVYSGTYTSSDGYSAYVYNSGGIINIVDGTFSGNKAVLKADYNNKAPAIINVLDGRFTGEIQKASQDEAQINISSGIFSQEVPVTYLAEGSTQVKNNDNTYTVKQIPVAEVNGTQYNSLAKAVAAAQNGQTVKLLENVDISTIGLAVHNTVTLDLNGKQIKAENSAAGQIKVFPEGDLTVLDSTDVQKNGSGTGKIWADTPYGANAAKGIVAVHGNFTMESGLIDTALEDPTNKGQFGMGIFENGTIVVNGGKIQAGWAPISGNGDSTFAGASITINGGELVSTVDYAIYIPHPGTLTINGGKINGAAGAVAMNRGNLKVTGGEFTSDGTGDTGSWGDGTGKMGVATLNLHSGYGDVNAVITGGTFSMTGTDKDLVKTSVNPEKEYKVELEISGGTYSSDVSAYVVEYCEIVQTGNVYEVKKRAADKPVVKEPENVPQENQAAVTATVTAAENAKAEGVADAVPTEKVEEALKIAEADPKVELPVPEENQTRQTSVGIQVSVNSDTKFGDSVTGTAVVSYDIKPVLIVQVVDDKGLPVESKAPVALPLTDKNEVVKAPEGQSFSVELPLPEKFVENADEAKELIVKHISDSGAYEYVTPKTAETGKLVIEITHFSTFEITKKVAADGLTISPAKLNATTGSPVRLTATLTPADATENITWSSGDETIAKVNEKGEVLPLKPGTVTITATADSGKTATAEVTITNPAVIIPDTGLKLDKASLELEPGKTGVLKATLTPSNATYKYIFWESSDEKVATVSDGGLVTAIAEGAATITAKSWYGNTAACEVTVKKADVPTPPDPVDPWPTEGLEGFVTRCYRVALSRDPDKAGHADWVRWLKDGTVDATSCTYGFVFSKEMNNKNLSDEDFVKTLYRLFMDREGEATGVAFWTKYLKDGHSRLEVFNGFTDSVEFARIKASYGIK